MEKTDFLCSLMTAVLVALLTPARTCDPNLQPVIGILVQDLNETDLYPNTNYLAASYVKFVEMFGGRAVPIFPDRDESYYQFLATKLNGVLLPGGDVDLYTGSYRQMSEFFYDYSVNLADTKHQNFPILGICLGFEMLSTLAANGKNVMSHTDSSNQLSTIELTKYGKEESLIFNAAPDWLLDGAETAQVAPNFHSFSLLKSTYDSNEEIQKIFNVVSYSYDRNNVKFVSIMESKKYPLLGVQHHPEKNLFEWATASNYAHSFLGYSYSQYFGDYFVQMARTSCQKFDSEEQLSPYLIYNYPVTYTQGQFKDKHFTQCYLFDQTEDDCF